MLIQKEHKNLRYIIIILFIITMVFTLFQYIPLPISGMCILITFLLSFFLFSLTHAAFCYGWRSALVFAVLTLIITLIFESIGVTTGIIYGRYYYTDFSGYKFFGLIPFYIPIAWFMMIYPSYVISGLIIPKHNKISLIYSIERWVMAGIVMTAWDLTMDPRLSTEWGFWVWIDKGVWFGVPIHNYIGWLITAITIYILYDIYNKYTHTNRYETYDYLSSKFFINLPVFSYMIMAANEVTASLIINQPLLAIVAVFSMGSFSIIAILNSYFRTS